jgi:chloride channel protein, CIC family
MLYISRACPAELRAQVFRMREPLEQSVWSRVARVRALGQRGMSIVRRARRSTDRHGGAVWREFVNWFDSLELSENTILLGFGVLIGAGAALAVVAFYGLIDLAFTVLYRWPQAVFSRSLFIAYRPIVTALGLSLAWQIVKRTADSGEGMNVPAVQLAVAQRGGVIATRPAVARTAASAVTLGGGGSAGSEGPVAVLGAALGSFLGQAFRFDSSRVKILVAAGAAAGISAAFNAPLTGAFFALEEILGSLAVGAFPAVVLSSVVAAVVSRSFFGNHPAISMPTEYGYSHIREIVVFYPILGLLAALVTVLFVRTYFRVEQLASSTRLPDWLLPIIGGLIVGLMVYASRGTLVGYGHLALRIDVLGRMAWYALLLLALGKILATSITLHLGGSGGVFTPSLYVGAATGGSFGAALARMFPDLTLRPEAYALVGMGAVVAAATAAPITGIMIVFEMTNDYAIMLPLMLTTVIACVLARQIEPDSLYSGWLRRRGEHIEHGAERDVLAGIRVPEACHPNARVIRESASVHQLLENLEHTDQTDFPVVDREERLVGVITLADLGRLARHSQSLADIVVAADIAIPAETVSPGDSLLEAIRRMGVRGVGSIPMIDPGTGRFLGLVTRAHVLALYERTVASSSPHAPSEPHHSSRPSEDSP